MLLASRSVSAQSTVVSVDPGNSWTNVDNRFAVDINIADAPDPVFKVQVYLSWNSSFLNVVRWQEGEFLKGLNGTTQPVFKANNTAGLLQFWNNRSDPQNGGVIGSGTLMTLAFQGTSVTPEPRPEILLLHDVHLMDPSNNEITVAELRHGLFAVIIPEFPPSLILPLFMTMTVVAVIISRRKHTVKFTE